MQGHEVEDELHFLLTCSALHNEREILIQCITDNCINFIKYANKDTFIWLMNNEKIKIKRQCLRLWGPSEIHGPGPFRGFPCPVPMYRLNPPLICPAFYHSRFCNPREDSLSFFIVELSQVFKRLSTLNDISAVALATGMLSKTHNIVRAHY
jgi:hypothetical protein